MDALEVFREVIFNRMEKGIYGQDVPYQKINDTLSKMGLRTFDLNCSICRSELVPYVYELLKNKKDA